MTQYSRYALYYLCPPGPLADFGARWLGWDAISGEPAAHPDVPGLPQPPAEITATPRKYGFHATIKPPFRLAEGQDETALARATADLCARLAPARVPGLQLTRLGGFLALTITGDSGPVDRIAAQCVETLDPFRRPPDEDELARRRARGLSTTQEALLARWGYPFVMEEFRFHMTLTGRLPRAEATATQTALEPVLSPLLPRPFTLDSLCLAGEDAQGRFHLIRRFALG